MKFELVVIVVPADVLKSCGGAVLLRAVQAGRSAAARRRALGPRHAEHLDLRVSFSICTLRLFSSAIRAASSMEIGVPVGAVAACARRAWRGRGPGSLSESGHRHAGNEQEDPGARYGGTHD